MTTMNVPKITFTQLIILGTLYLYIASLFIPIEMQFHTPLLMHIVVTYTWLTIPIILEFAISKTSQTISKDIILKSISHTKKLIYSYYVALAFMLITWVNSQNIESGFAILNFVIVIILGTMTLIFIAINCYYLIITLWRVLLIPFDIIFYK